jgi:hypothetical protein
MKCRKRRRYESFRELRRQFMKAILVPFFIILATVLFVYGTRAQSAGAPRIYNVEFVRGVFESTGTVQPYYPCSPAVPQGVCGNGNSKGYSLFGRAKDRITIRLRSNTGGAVFSIFTPDDESVERGGATTFWSGELPVAGYYRINVFTSRSSTPFRIRIARLN